MQNIKQLIEKSNESIRKNCARVIVCGDVGDADYAFSSEDYEFDKYEELKGYFDSFLELVLDENRAFTPDDLNDTLDMCAGVVWDRHAHTIRSIEILYWDNDGVLHYLKRNKNFARVS